jgi:mannose-6-phosphate isomerase-like protein (cupin superfamily)
MSGWFIVNVADAPALRHERAGAYVRFEPPDDRFPDFGVNIHVLEPGEPSGRYHREEAQEDFLVLSGACLVIIDGEERPLRAWDFVHCPAGTDHIFVGAGDGPCAILMIGARGLDRGVHYPVSQLAAAYGASVATPTDVPAEAYADWPGEFTPTELDWPPRA